MKKITKKDIEALLGFKIEKFEIKKDKGNNVADVYIFPKENHPKYLIMNFTLNKKI